MVFKSKKYCVIFKTKHSAPSKNVDNTEIKENAMINCNENGVRAKFRAVTEASRAPCATERRGRRKNLPIQSTIIAEPHDYKPALVWLDAALS